MKRSKIRQTPQNCAYPKQLNRLFARFYGLDDKLGECRARLERIGEADQSAAQALRLRMRRLEHLKNKTLSLAAAGCAGQRTLFAHYHPLQARIGEEDPFHPAAAKWKRYQDFVCGKIHDADFAAGPALRKLMDIAQYPSFHDSVLQSFEPASPGWAIASFRGYFNHARNSIYLLVPDRDALFLINKIPYKASLADALGPEGARARSPFSKKIHHIGAVDVLEDEWSLDPQGFDRVCFGLFRQKDKAFFEMRLSVRAVSLQKHELISLAEQEQLQACPAAPGPAHPKPRI